MMLLKTKKVKEYEDIYKDILSVYFDYLHKKNLNLTPIGISELLRYSLCCALNLNTIASNNYIEDNCYELIQNFKTVLNKYNVYNKSVLYRQGLLEACIHCIEMSRAKAGYK